jgi:putative transposase
MPGRTLPLVNGQIYHVFNRGINRCPTFTSKKEYFRALDTFRYYQFSGLPHSLSKYLNLEIEKKHGIVNRINSEDKIITIFCYCLMPNHFHLLIRQEKDKGISRFMSNIQNSYTRYFNTRNNRDGSLFLDQFKAVLIETDEQFLHVSRYIHLNPFTSYIIKSLDDLEKYPWSSYQSYIKSEQNIVDISYILSNFINGEEYRKFVVDQADYQRRLKEIEHLILD